MITLYDGQRVAFVGHPGDGFEIGDEGIVLSAGFTGSHVKWATGERRGAIDLVSNDDLVVQVDRAGDEDLTMAEGTIVSTSVRQVFDRHGARGLVRALRQEGHLDVLAPLAEEVLGTLCASLRRNPAVLEVLARLDEDEGGEFVSQMASTLMREVTG